MAAGIICLVAPGGALADDSVDTSACSQYAAQAHPVQYSYITLTAVPGTTDAADAVLCLRDVLVETQPAGGKSPELPAGLFVSAPTTPGFTFRSLAVTPNAATAAVTSTDTGIDMNWPTIDARGTTWAGGVRLRIEGTPGKVARLFSSATGATNFTGMDNGNNSFVTLERTAADQPTPPMPAPRINPPAPGSFGISVMRIGGYGIITAPSVGDNDGIRCPDLCKMDSVKEGTTITVTAWNTPHGRFSKWRTGPCAGVALPACQFKVSGPTTVMAQFAVPVHHQLLRLEVPPRRSKLLGPHDTPKCKVRGHAPGRQPVVYTAGTCLMIVDRNDTAVLSAAARPTSSEATKAFLDVLAPGVGAKALKAGGLSEVTVRGLKLDYSDGVATGLWAPADGVQPLDDLAATGCGALKLCAAFEGVANLLDYWTDRWPVIQAAANEQCLAIPVNEKGLGPGSTSWRNLRVVGSRGRGIRIAGPKKSGTGTQFVRISAKTLASYCVNDASYIVRKKK